MRFWNRHSAEDFASAVSFSAMAKLKKKGALLAFLKDAGRMFTPDDLEIMMERYSAKTAHLPEGYKTRLAKYARIQIIDGFHQMMTCTLEKVHEEEKLPADFKKFARFAETECIKGTEGDRRRTLKFLIAAFTVYILNEPVHPVGMPFPGGFCVEKYDGVYYCPVRAVWNEVDAALCRFCPAVQSRERDLMLSKKERDFVTASEKLNNYFYNFKG
ncbi:MAG TPA: DUF2115 domain-containing protein [Methanocorpusculum sp.]|nr:DUF2115 domain-containing protein [Methanocorpusculum sp.]